VESWVREIREFVTSSKLAPAKEKKVSENLGVRVHPGRPLDNSKEKVERKLVVAKIDNDWNAKQGHSKPGEAQEGGNSYPGGSRAFDRFV